MNQANGGCSTSLSAFSDRLLGSTELSQHLDPEDLAEVIRRYQDVVSGAIARYGGHVAKFMGDGVLAYFGWPQAHEDQAERAVRAGLDSIAAVRTIAGPGGAALRSRVGIATGLVVVGDLVSEAASDLEAVVGSTPNLAARLQAVAAPEQLVIETETRRLIGDTFGLHSLGDLSLKGFEAPVPTWQLGPHTPSETRFAARQARVIGKLIGRDAEQELLSERWRLAIEGRSQAVSVYGEAGIGKSRLVWDFANSLGDDSHARILYDCSPYHTHSVLYPAVQHLKRACGAVPKESRTTNLERLRQYLRTSGVVEDAHHRALAELLALKPENAASRRAYATAATRKDDRRIARAHCRAR